MSHKRLRAFALAPLVLASLVCAAAQEKPAPAPSNLVLQVTYFEGAPTSFQIVPRGPEMVGAWFGRFKVIPRPAGSKDAAPVQAVNVVSRTEGEGVRIKVSVFLGQEMFDREEPVGTYAANVNDEVVTKGLERFGVEPFRITVRPMKTTLSAPPVVVNKTQSVEAAIGPPDSPGGAGGKLSLRNLASKRVAAVEFSETRDGRLVWTRFAHEPEGRTLIEPGGVYSAVVSQARRGEISPEGFYIPYAPESILVSAAVFEDGTYEGAPGAAARLVGEYEGARAQLTRALALLNQAAPGPGAAARLKARLAALTHQADAAAVEAIYKRYPGLDDFRRGLAKSSVEVAMHTIRKDLLDGLTALGEEPDAARLGDWLKSRREQLSAWLERLPAPKSAAR